MPSALLLPVLTCAVVLLVSGVAKLRDPDAVDTAFVDLDVPAGLRHPLLRRALPWVEIALGVWLVLATGSALVVVAALTLGLFLAYLWLVVRAVRMPEAVDCGCFGALGDTRVTAVTVWRNIALVASAALSLALGLSGSGVLAALLEDPSLWGWLATAALAAAVTGLVLYRPTAADPVTAVDGVVTGELPVDDDGDYLPTPAPVAQLLDEAGALVLLSRETPAAAHLLIFLNPGCGSCEAVKPFVAQWSQDLAPVTVRAVLMVAPAALTSTWPDLSGLAWFDPNGVARRAFGCATPGAVLIGTDGNLAGGPVNGAQAVTEFVDEIAEQLRAAHVTG
ncbi:MauE/DoxX family redox-associated membrane protein [Ornithinibacter sp.]|uniref:MauE/DoxX family redox-associated membrane protein n=1 Tax=Ornithinibacter sp. TaxID=2862748 RepID=UPI002C209F11|nr:MauE/DoxX family redox-associated membrane protein [Ornithinibacter sp.]HRA27240.1 MauE/DoxX family redox-associated membrane protein [Ornithinibacter sp.]